MARRGRGAPLSGTYMAAHAQQPAHPPTTQHNISNSCCGCQATTVARCVCVLCVCVLGQVEVFGKEYSFGALPSQPIYYISPPFWGDYCAICSMFLN